MRCEALATRIRLCQQGSSAIEEGRSRNKAPTEATYCLMCRTERRRRANLKHIWRPEYDDYLKAHYYGGLNRRFQVLNRMIRETGLPRWYINFVAIPVMWHSTRSAASDCNSSRPFHNISWFDLFYSRDGCSIPNFGGRKCLISYSRALRRDNAT